VFDLLAALDIENLSRPVAARGDETTVVTETHAANNTRVDKVVHKLHVEDATHPWVEDCVPIVSFAFQVWRKGIDRKVDKLIAAATQLMLELLVLRHDKALLLLSKGWWWGGTWHCRRTRIWVYAVLLWGGRATRGSSEVVAGLTRAGRCCWLRWWLGTIA